MILNLKIIKTNEFLRACLSSVNQVSNLLVNLIIASRLSTYEYSYFAFASLIILFIFIFTQLGLNLPLINDLEKYKDSISFIRIWVETILIKFFVLFLLFIFFYFYIQNHHITLDDNLKYSLIFLSLSLVLDPIIFMQARKKLHFIFPVTIILKLISVLYVYMFVYDKNNFYVVFIIQAIIYLISFLIFCYHFRSSFGLITKLKNLQIISRLKKSIKIFTSGELQLYSQSLSILIASNSLSNSMISILFLIDASIRTGLAIFMGNVELLYLRNIKNNSVNLSFLIKIILTIILIAIFLFFISGKVLVFLLPDYYFIEKSISLAVIVWLSYQLFYFLNYPVLGLINNFSFSNIFSFVAFAITFTITFLLLLSGVSIDIYLFYILLINIIFLSILSIFLVLKKNQIRIS